MLVQMMIKELWPPPAIEKEIGLAFKNKIK